MFNRIESIDISQNTITQLNGKVLQLNQRYFNDEQILKKQLEKWLNDKYIPSGCNDIIYIVTHEYMHLITQDEIDNVKSSAHAIFRIANASEFVSRYSTVNTYEFVGELLAVNNLSGKTNKPINKLLK